MVNETITISPTEIQGFNVCARKWAASSLNAMGMTPIVPATALSTGTLTHLSLADWRANVSNVNGQGSCDPIQIVMGHAQTMITNVRAAKAQAIMGSKYNPDNDYTKLVPDSELESSFEASKMALALVKNYVDYYGSPFPEGFRLIAPEQTIVCRIPGSPHFMSMTLDALVCDSHDNILFNETKTFNRHPTEDQLEHNFQFLCYLWGIEHALNVPAYGVLYDGLWKRVAPPRGRTIDDLFLRKTLIRSRNELAELTPYLVNKAEQMYNYKNNLSLALLDYHRD